MGCFGVYQKRACHSCALPMLYSDVQSSPIDGRHTWCGGSGLSKTDLSPFRSFLAVCVNRRASILGPLAVWPPTHIPFRFPTLILSLTVPLVPPRSLHSEFRRSVINSWIPASATVSLPRAPANTDTGDPRCFSVASRKPQLLESDHRTGLHLAAGLVQFATGRQWQIQGGVTVQSGG